MAKRVDLTGRWTGVYFYPPDPVLNPFDDCPPTPFIAELSDASGAVAGTTSEPDMVYGNRDIPSVIDGVHDGSALSFVKFSQAAEGFEEAIHYEGAISDNGLSIDGRWSIPGSWSGAFRMERQSGAAACRQTAAADSMSP